MKSKLVSASLVLVAGFALPTLAQDEVTIKAQQLSNTVYMLQGSGGNIGVSIGEDGTLMVDDQFAHLSEKIAAKINELGGSQPNFVINTHWHYDHTGGNENFGGDKGYLVAHDNVRKRLKAGGTIAAFNRVVPPAVKAALPVLTYSKGMSIHYNGERVELIHLASAHTDGDSIVHFVDSNIIHAGDIYFNGLFPFIDGSSGGGMDGVIAAVNAILSLANDDTQIIPGHGPMSNKAELTQYRDMLVTVASRMRTLMEQGKSIEEIVAAKPTKGYEALGNGFIKTDDWVKLVYQLL